MQISHGQCGMLWLLYGTHPHHSASASSAQRKKKESRTQKDATKSPGDAGYDTRTPSSDAGGTAQSDRLTTSST